MPKYKLWPAGEEVEIKSLKDYVIALSGAKVLVKVRPPVAKEVSTD